MKASDDLHRQPSRGSVVHQADQHLRGGGVTDGLEGRGALTAGHI